MSELLDANGNPLPPGMQSMGLVDDINPDELRERLAEGNILNTSVHWIQEDTKGEPDLWTPYFVVKDLGDFLGAKRAGKNFYPTEKRMVIMYFANRVAETLFHEPMFEEITDGNTLHFNKIDGFDE